MKRFFLICILFLPFSKSHAFFGDGGAGWAQIPYLVQIVQENIKRFKQLRDIQNFKKLIHEGVIDLHGLLELVPIDEETADYLRQIEKTRKQIEEIYGEIPKSPDFLLHKENDRVIAESITLQNSLAAYTKTQEHNANRLTRQARGLSPKGAAQATVISNAQILHALNQLIKVNGQLLKLQGQKLAIENRNQKNDVKNFLKDTQGLKKWPKLVNSGEGR